MQSAQQVISKKPDPYRDWHKAYAEDVQRTDHWNNAKLGTKLVNPKLNSDKSSDNR
jgi:hypothetical protein